MVVSVRVFHVKFVIKKMIHLVGCWRKSSSCWWVHFWISVLFI